MRPPRPRIAKVGTIEEDNHQVVFKDWWFTFDPYYCSTFIEAHYPNTRDWHDMPGFVGYSYDELRDIALLGERFPRLSPVPDDCLGRGWLKIGTARRRKSAP